MSEAHGRATAARVLLAVCLLGTACGGGSGASCPNDVPATCPSSTSASDSGSSSGSGPSFATEVRPLLQQRCGACHTAGGLAFTHPFDSYEQIQFYRTSIAAQLHVCYMPPADQPQPTPAERQTIFAWIVCGAMNN